MIELPPLPYAEAALEPYISEETISFHYGKHHAGYVKTANELIAGTDLVDKSLEDIILTAASDTVYTKLFNNAAQVYNHNFYWNSLTADEADKKIPPELEAKIIADFGPVEALKAELKKQALAQFGSGWTWLVLDGDKLKVVNTSNANTPLTAPTQKPLLCIDVWEHAYYLDRQNLRAAYLDGVIDHALNWAFAAQNLKV